MPDKEFSTGTNGVLMGQISKYIQLKNESNVSIIGVRFYPWGLYRWLHFPLHEITNTSLSIADAFGNTGKNLRDLIYESKSIQQAISLIENFLFKTQKNSLNSVVKEATTSIIEKNGVIEVKNLAKQTGFSTRYIHKVFKNTVGLSPKRFARIIRLQKNLTYLNSVPKSQLTQIAYFTNFFDQAHFIHDFKELVGITPSEYLQEKHLLSDFLTKSLVLFFYNFN
jgi:AraC-like DNA-binding protein